MAARGRQRAIIALSGGVIAGVFAGIVASLYGLLSTVARGVDPWIVFKWASAPFLDDRAFAPGFDAGAVVLGILVHFAVSITWGALFGLLVFGANAFRTLVFGAAYGVIVWFVMYKAVLPAVGLGAIAARVPVGPAILEHVIFGLALAIGFLPFQRRAPTV
ncbi:hypothetical protein [Polyangium jinanense]|uniref:DUF1440 domain-containing protein n=1 Tax=Polyangium jinanense TaxID=2829994 RepID=A0A9X3X600_9BACT|nr:hypothetical protein [Polyangium jinanense]MDC3960072.1 hypothetical protein [Polyangium jinanense]MDC3984389.1 hypothetical protein [Polyangium jinanense]